MEGRHPTPLQHRTVIVKPPKPWEALAPAVVMPPLPPQQAARANTALPLAAMRGHCQKSRRRWPWGCSEPWRSALWTIHAAVSPASPAPLQALPMGCGVPLCLVQALLQAREGREASWGHRVLGALSPWPSSSDAIALLLFATWRWTRSFSCCEMLCYHAIPSVSLTPSGTFEAPVIVAVQHGNTMAAAATMNNLATTPRAPQLKA